MIYYNDKHWSWLSVFGLRVLGCGISEPCLHMIVQVIWSSEAVARDESRSVKD